MHIPAGSRVFWDVSNAVPLLYAPNVIIHYPQIYSTSILVEGGNADQLQKIGLWNDTLAMQWWEESNYIVLQKDYAAAYLPENFDPTQFDVFQTEPLNPCDPSSFINIYHKKP
jgi:hypothetical protein